MMYRRPGKMLVLRLISVFITAAVMMFAASIQALAYDDDVSIEPIHFNNTDFIRGMDVSSVISLERSGVRYFNAAGRRQDIFRILADNGVNYIRVRVWNDPYDKEGIGYGGGNCDVDTAAEIGRRAAYFGMKLLVDFHYSDFWADPGKQKSPKAWDGLSLDERAAAVESFTAESLRKISGAGAKIGMVQIGNETNSGIAGVSSFDDIPAVFRAASSAVRDFDPDILIAVHFTGPEDTQTIKWRADYMNENNIDYDVFAVSYYPYWHGSLSNLTSVLSYAAEEYDKYVMVAETSYAYTFDDSDGHPNTVTHGSNDNGDDLLWDFSPQGQAEELRAVMSAVNDVPNSRGLGVFYWEGAWITVGDTSGLIGDELNAAIESNRAVWELNGSGWAASSAGEYDSDAGVYCGGSAVDNQAFFAPDGRALPSLKAFAMVNENFHPMGDADLSGERDILDATMIQRYLAMLEDISSEQMALADLDLDGETTILDATRIQRILAELTV